MEGSLMGEKASPHPAQLGSNLCSVRAGRIDALRCRVAFLGTPRVAELERLNRAGALLYLGQKAGGPVVPRDPDICSPQAAPETLSWSVCKPRKQRGNCFGKNTNASIPRQGLSQAVPVAKNPPASAENIRDAGSIPGSGRSPGGGHGNPLQGSCLENPMDRGACRATVHGWHRVGHD